MRVGAKVGITSEAHCDACSYRTTLFLGGGRSNHLTYAAWPVFCATCTEVTTANFKNTPLRCSKCDGDNVMPADDRRVYDGPGKVSQKWPMDDDVMLTLQDGNYRCPKCEQFELKFTPGRGRWD